jgi:hypothetical protein
MLWQSNFTDVFVPGYSTYEFFGPMDDGVLTIYQRQTRQWYGYDEYTGAKLWGPTEAYPDAWDQFIGAAGTRMDQTEATIAYGNLYVATYAGNIYCHDLHTGALKWTYSLPTTLTTAYGDYPITGMSFADGKLYATTNEHTPDSPYWLGSAMYCINATTGDFICKMPGWWSASPAIADGYALDHNCYDGKIYCFGKGQTSVTVTAPDTAVTQGQRIVIKGTVMDESPGAIDYAGNRLSTKGTPAIADAYMTQWMEYLYQQKSMPTNATGVPVTLSVLDSNGNYREIGSTTSDTDGFYSFTWTPDIAGKYTLYASFAGSESYWSSHAVTAFDVSDEPEAAQPTSAPPSTADLYFIPATVGIVLAIVIVGIVTVLALRKRP